MVADVFTDAPLAGNPVAIFTDGRELGNEEMQRLRQDKRGPEGRMTRELELGLRCEDPDAHVAVAFGREHEDRLGEIELEREPLHLVVV